jgi:hypothetical protein
MRFRLSVAMALLCAILGVAAPAQAQLNSNETTIAMSADLLESLTVIVLPGLVHFPLTSGSASNPGSTPVVVTTTWTFALTRTSVKLYAYFTSASAALVHTQPANTVDIPSSRVQVSVNGGSNQALNQTVAFGGASAGAELFNQPLTLLNIVGARVDTLTFNIDLSNYILPVDVYTGTLRLRAQATP